MFLTVFPSRQAGQVISNLESLLSKKVKTRILFGEETLAEVNLKVSISPTMVNSRAGEVTRGVNTKVLDSHNWELPPTVLPVVDNPVGGRLAQFC